MKFLNSKVFFISLLLCAASPHTSLASCDAHDLLRQAFLKTYSRFEEIGVPENEHFVELAEHDLGGKHIYLDLNFKILKEVNDHILQNKNFADAVANAYKKTAKSLLEKARNEGNLSDLVASYSDYKSIRFAFRKGNPRINTELKKLAEDTAVEFQKQIQTLNLQFRYDTHKGIAKNPLTWHLAGIGETADEARAAATLAEDLNQGSPGKLQVKTFSQLRPRLVEHMQELRMLEASLAEDPKLLQHRILEAANAEGRYVLSSDVMNLIKISDSTSDFAKKISRAYGLNLFPEQAQKIVDWFHQVDATFSPGIYQTSRVSVHSLPSDAGVTSGDYRGLSSRKIHATMQGLASVNDANPSQALRAVREQFTLDHSRLLKQHERIGKIADHAFDGADIQFSGDDLIIRPEAKLTHAQKEAFTSQIHADAEANQIRIVFCDLKNTEERSKVVVQGELLEKAVWKKLVGRIPYQNLRTLTFSMDLLKDQTGRLNVEPIVAGAISKADQSAISAAVNEAMLRDFHGMKLTPITFLK